MKSAINPLLLSALLAVVGLPAAAQGAGQGGPMQVGGTMQHERMDPAKMQERMAKRQAELKAKLQLNPTQEGAWSNYIQAMQPSADMAARMSPEARRKMRDEMQSLSTPQRIDRMHAMKALHDAERSKREEATKYFYSFLTPEQQKVFDANAMHHGPGGRHAGKPGQNG